MESLKNLNQAAQKVIQYVERIVLEQKKNYAKFSPLSLITQSYWKYSKRGWDLNSGFTIFLFVPFSKLLPYCKTQVPSSNMNNSCPTKVQELNEVIHIKYIIDYLAYREYLINICSFPQSELFFLFFFPQHLSSRQSVQQSTSQVSILFGPFFSYECPGKLQASLTSWLYDVFPPGNLDSPRRSGQSPFLCALLYSPVKIKRLK